MAHQASIVMIKAGKFFFWPFFIEYLYNHTINKLTEKIQKSSSPVNWINP